MADLSYLDFTDEFFEDIATATISQPSLVIARRVVSFAEAGLNRRNAASIYKVTNDENIQIPLGLNTNSIPETEVNGKYVIIPIGQVTISEEDFKTSSL